MIIPEILKLPLAIILWLIIIAYLLFLSGYGDKFEDDKEYTDNEDDSIY